MTLIRVEGMAFHGHHGVSDAEKVAGHPMRLDLVASVDESARDTDRIEDTVDYATVAAVALEVATGQTFNTLERAVDRIGNELLARFDRIRSLKVTLVKLNPELPISIDRIGVSRSFARGPESPPPPPATLGLGG